MSDNSNLAIGAGAGAVAGAGAGFVAGAKKAKNILGDAEKKYVAERMEKNAERLIDSGLDFRKIIAAQKKNMQATKDNFVKSDAFNKATKMTKTTKAKWAVGLAAAGAAIGAGVAFVAGKVKAQKADKEA